MFSRIPGMLGTLGRILFQGTRGAVQGASVNAIQGKSVEEGANEGFIKGAGAAALQEFLSACEGPPLDTNPRGGTRITEESVMQDIRRLHRPYNTSDYLDSVSRHLDSPSRHFGRRLDDDIDLR